MTCAHFGADISRDMESDGSTNLGSSSPSWLGLTTTALTCCCDVEKLVQQVSKEVINLYSAIKSEDTEALCYWSCKEIKKRC